MKVFKLFLATFVLMFAVNASAQKFKVSDVSIAPGGTADMVFSIESSEVAFSGQFYIKLPKGISLAKKYSEDEDEYVLDFKKGQLEQSKGDIHIATIANDTIRVLIYNLDKMAFKQASGTLLTLRLKADDDIAIGTYPISISLIKVIKLDTYSIYSGTDGPRPGYFPNMTVNITVTKDPTAISKVTVDPKSSKKGTYTLDGKKVSKITESGVYIVDGKKVVVKK